ncbi:MAG: TIGR02206 family membrane protein [Chloroflexota bacterium]|nr:TIGR02206 family membrane protein [Chloroflexota bacterium]MBI5701984.1 TIGR02206 family membrane protein [Chloroflexota bacterium]
MEKFFAGNYAGPAFQLFGAAHLGALLALALLNMYLFRFKHAEERARSRVRWILALILWGNEIAWHAWNYAAGKWTIQTMLPLHLCSVLVWAGAWMLVTKNYHIYEFMYLLGIGGAIQALATPDLGIYGFPHFRFFQTFISHGLIVTSAIYMTVVEGFRPTWGSIGRVAVWMNVYVVIVYFINNAIGSNYLMINHKPETPSLLDLLPEWPLYILYIEAIGLVTVLLLYAPFAVKDWKARATQQVKA